MNELSDVTEGANSLTRSYAIETVADADAEPSALVMNWRLAVFVADAVDVALASLILIAEAVDPAADPPPDANPSKTSTAAEAVDDDAWIVFAAASIMNSPVGDETDADALTDAPSPNLTLTTDELVVADADTVATPSR